MKKYVAPVILLLFACKANSQTIIQKDTVIENMVNEVSKDSLLSYIQTLANFGTRNTLSTQTSSTKGIGAARNYVLKKFQEFAKQSGGRLTAFIDTTTLQPDSRRVDRSVVLGNVVATLKGTNANDNRVLIISGHLDSRRTNVMDSVNDAPGADDDASGVAALMECARIMSKRSFSSTIIFVAVSGEEQGLLGSTFMAEKAKQNNWNVEAVLNNDIVGSNNSNETNIINNTQVRVFSEALSIEDTGRALQRIRFYGLENDGKSRQLARYVKETGERYVDNLEVKMIYRTDRYLRGGDHLPYIERGYAGVRITEMNENFNHQHQDIRMENGIQYGDLIKYIDPEYLCKTTSLNLCNLANLAKAPSSPQQFEMDVKELTNFSTLHWEKPAIGNAKGYYVLIRETTSPVWQKKIYTEQTDIKLPYSKDNYFFGVQAISNDGNESLAVVPTPSRN
jgi:hypothetical protein